jgi:DNA-binding transcriptional MerR regulator
MNMEVQPLTPVHRIGEAAQRSGVSAANIRYYEREGLLKLQARAGNDYRLYSEADIHRLRFIRQCRALDMSLDEVRTLLALELNSKADCATASTALDAHLGHVRQRLAELRVLERDLLALRKRCDGSDDHCHIIEALHQRADEALPGVEPPAGHRHV